MADVAYFYPPKYQKAPAGSNDSLGGGSRGAGTPGAPGKDGASTLTGSLPPPDSLGKDGDTYILLNADGDALQFWGPKTGGHWPASGVSMRGAAGAPGVDAPFPIAGDGPPDPNNVGRPGQIFLDRINAQIYLATA